MNQENSQEKYRFVFEAGSNPMIVNDNHGTINNYANHHQAPSENQQRVKEAIETLDREGLLREGVQWWAIYRVLTAHCGYPLSKPAFCRVIEDLKPEVSVACVYERWRNVSPARLVPNVETWATLRNSLQSPSEISQASVGVRLLEILASSPSPAT